MGFFNLFKLNFDKMKANRDYNALKTILISNRRWDERIQAQKCLYELGWVPETLEEKVDYYLIQKDKEAILNLGKDAIDILIKNFTLRNIPMLYKVECFDVIAQIGGPESKKFILDCLMHDELFYFRSLKASGIPEEDIGDFFEMWRGIWNGERKNNVWLDELNRNEIKLKYLNVSKAKEFIMTMNLMYAKKVNFELKAEQQNNYVIINVMKKLK
jgi:hypothetical protein